MNQSTLERRIAQLERIIEITHSLNATHSLQPLLIQILEAGRELTGSEASSIMLVDRKTGELHFEAATGERSQEISKTIVPLEGSVAGWVVRHEQPLIVSDTRSDNRFYGRVDEASGFTTSSLLAVPLALRGKVIGVLEAVNKVEEETFSQENVETLSILADQAAVAIENALLFEQSDMISEIVHEMRTPLASISGYAQLIERPDIPAEMRHQFARTIQQEALRLSQMAGDYLELARLESGRTFLIQESVPTARIIKEALAVLRPQAEAKQIFLGTALPPSLPAVFGDPTRLKQTLINLLSNAIKYSRKGDSVTVVAELGEDVLRIGVQDTGPGIPADAQARLFQRFYRLPSVENEVEGSGLGLAICRQIVESHGGQIWVESQVDHGATFYFTVPLCKSD